MSDYVPDPVADTYLLLLRHAKSDEQEVPFNVIKGWTKAERLAVYRYVRALPNELEMPVCLKAFFGAKDESKL